jgi:hypothetical protein
MKEKKGDRRKRKSKRKKKSLLAWFCCGFKINNKKSICVWIK